MQKTDNLEFWLRGPVPGIPPLLQPVAHALLQARDEVNALMDGFPEQLLWDRPAGLASPGFHLQHLTGVLDRLFTYANGEALSSAQLDYLAAEGTPLVVSPGMPYLLKMFNDQVDNALGQLRQTPESSLTQSRDVGRARLPSTVAGLLFHAAEHTQRHTGQLLVTARVLQPSPNPGNLFNS